MFVLKRDLKEKTLQPLTAHLFRKSVISSFSSEMTPPATDDKMLIFSMRQPVACFPCRDPADVFGSGALESSIRTKRRAHFDWN